MQFETISDVYFKYVGKISFYLLVGITSTAGQYVLVKYLLATDWIAGAVSSIWAVVMIMVYAYHESVKHSDYTKLVVNYENLRLIKTPMIVSNTKMTPTTPIE
jgi:hypothetical protein